MTGLELGLLWLAWIVGGASPGPATLALASTGLAHGRAPALALAAGIVTGSAIWGGLAGAGLGALMLSHAWAAQVLRYAGGAYILWLALRSARSAMRPGIPEAGHAVPRSLRRAYLSGAVLHLANPRAIFAWGAVFAIAIPTDAGAGTIAFIWAFLLTGSVLVFFGYALLFSRKAAMARYIRLRRWFEGAFALLFGGAAIAVLSARPA